MKHFRRSDHGFTLVELMVGILISGMLLGTATTVFLMSQKLYTRSGDISYKQRNITTIETDLQNALSIASASGVKVDTVITGSNYCIGFKGGKCVEIINGEEYYNDQISVITVEVVNVNTMTYKITPIDTSMSILSGGVVMNNVKASPAFANATFNSGTDNYLVIQYATGP